jgi:periplasmic divalent cation tolerance protein
MTLVYITCKDEKEARKISMHLLKKRIIVCANVFPIKSMYWWQGKIVNGRETAIFAKTSSKNFDKIVKEVEKIHSYQVPCIIKLDAKSSKKYESWENSEIR